jgi:hypothetical protein
MTSWHRLSPTSWHRLNATSWHRLNPTSWHRLNATSWPGSSGPSGTARCQNVSTAMTQEMTRHGIDTVMVGIVPIRADTAPHNAMAPTQHLVTGSSASWPGPDPAICRRTCRGRSPVQSPVMTPGGWDTSPRGAFHAKQVSKDFNTEKTGRTRSSQSKRNNRSASRGIWLNAYATRHHIRLCELGVLPVTSVLESFLSDAAQIRTTPITLTPAPPPNRQSPVMSVREERSVSQRIKSHNQPQRPSARPRINPERDLSADRHP